MKLLNNFFFFVSAINVIQPLNITTANKSAKCTKQCIQHETQQIKQVKTASEYYQTSKENNVQNSE